MEKTREHMSFSGKVQMVGFRYKCNYIAIRLGLTGWVRNNEDGTVEGEFQGSKDSLNQMLHMLHEDAYIHIDGLERSEIPLREEERGFKVTG